MTISTPKDITCFLLDFKRYAQTKFTFVNRQKNTEFVTRRGVTHQDIKSEIFQLTYRHYVAGPERDRDRAGRLWMFGTYFVGEEVYIKLSDNFIGNVAKCISFHEAEHELRYKYN